MTWSWQGPTTCRFGDICKIWYPVDALMAYLKSQQRKSERIRSDSGCWTGSKSLPKHWWADIFANTLVSQFHPISPQNLSWPGNTSQGSKLNSSEESSHLLFLFLMGFEFDVLQVIQTRVDSLMIDKPKACSRMCRNEGVSIRFSCVVPRIQWMIVQVLLILLHRWSDWSWSLSLRCCSSRFV